MITLVREKGASAYIGEGLNRWAAVHVLDATHLYRLAFEKHAAGFRYHTVAEEHVSLRNIAEVIGRGLKVPVVAISQKEADGQFRFLALFVEIDLQGSSAKTQERLGWRTAGPKLLVDLERMGYIQA